MGEEQAAPKPEAAAAAAAVELTGFVMSAEEAKRSATATGVATVQDLLPLLVLSARKRAQVPISDFQVGALGLGASGRVYVGVNLEFRGVPLCHSVHAEQFLVANAAAAGESALRAVAVSHMPCGHCRQFLQEILPTGCLRPPGRLPPGPGAWSQPAPSRAARPASGEPATRAPASPSRRPGTSHHHQGKSRTLLV